MVTVQGSGDLSGGDVVDLLSDDLAFEIRDFIYKIADTYVTEIPTTIWGISVDKAIEDDGDGVEADIFNTQVGSGLPNKGEDRARLFAGIGYRMTLEVNKNKEGKNVGIPVAFGVAVEVWYADYDKKVAGGMGSSNFKTPSERLDRREGVMVAVRNISGGGKFMMIPFERGDGNKIILGDIKQDSDEDSEGEYTKNSLIFKQLKGLLIGASIATLEKTKGVGLDELFGDVDKEVRSKLIDAINSVKGRLP